MTSEGERQSDRVSRRKFLLTSGAVGAAGVAGCLGGGGDSTPTAEPADGDGGSDGNASTPTPEGMDTSTLKAEGSSTVYPISRKGSSYWNSNAPPSDGEYWGKAKNDAGETIKVPGWSEIRTDKNLADYFAGLYGYEPTGQQANPPFGTQVGLSHSGTGCKAVRDGLVDIGNSSGPITAELGISEKKAKNTYVDHVVGRDGQPVVVSSEIYEAGVKQLTGKQVRDIYQGRVSNWSEVGGPDKEIFVVGRAEGSGTDTSFRINMLGSANAPMEVDTRKGQNQQVKTVVANNDNAIGYMALAFTNEQVVPIAINFEGTVYKPDKDAEHTIYDSDYPLNRDLHMYTKKTDETPSGTSVKEAAFINMFLTTFGQKAFVEGVGYIPLPTKDIETEKEKLPDPEM
ncbi:MAG: phosphate ABC transporter substrate-binding protein [Haloarculaceae archaeon]